MRIASVKFAVVLISCLIFLVGFSRLFYAREPFEYVEGLYGSTVT